MKRLLVILAASIATVALAAAIASAGTAKSPSTAKVVIRHQTRGCHSWSLNGGPFKAAQTLSLAPCDLLVAGRHPSKLALLGKRGIRTGGPDTVAPGGFDVVVECTGNPDGLGVALSAVRPRGTVVLKSTYAGAVKLEASPVVVNELTLVGSRCGPFAPALRLLAERRVDVEPLIQARYPLRDGLAAFEHAARPGVLKVVLTP